ncbi:hypothetical protein BDA96_03G212100 [Sorghum bicolor]|uniref:Uncharacterized protein n=2 Tax=Sorghum bicolor TaxID=4558 RepID=A0A1B6Q4C5_SORBI|nr:hypothetical protein BDA96_03G212100 [Sorghum bicolor]KXG32764.1 hypothetical protein SORBI_3003G195800 [Sorghum bicolor]
MAGGLWELPKNRSWIRLSWSFGYSWTPLPFDALVLASFVALLVFLSLAFNALYKIHSDVDADLMMYPVSKQNFLTALLNRA